MGLWAMRGGMSGMVCEHPTETYANKTGATLESKEYEGVRRTTKEHDRIQRNTKECRGIKRIQRNIEEHSGNMKNRE